MKSCLKFLAGIAVLMTLPIEMTECKTESEAAP